ncbi:von Willebrand factor A domain-containing protein 5A isoform X2 [Anolis carolinensis]|uniref:von Willebrand factor A domain containing 5A n=1 Tax=Anolis carolinensis TaxID=28377 RepID=H9GDC3_ANOCA|nr:PREDICTED: von Willebrand factor A domain-containing protein 5A isoform X2 [Anolis carolinensis]|eukprot:XP_008114725.1 PREDICTED: von Willebrand factor A domain-containing protein 5A isoform X2 [Anolis carolinensis]
MDTEMLPRRKYPDKVPLRSISVDVVIQDFVADVVSELQYKNEDTVPLEVVFDMRLDKDVAVYAFEGIMDGTQIEAQIMEKWQVVEKVKENWGKDASLFKWDPKDRDIFGCILGSLPPGGEATLKLCYTQPLAPASDGSIRFVLPVVPNPCNVPQGPEDENPMQITPEIPEEQLLSPLSLSAALGSYYAISHVKSNYTLAGFQYTTEDRTTAQVCLAEGHYFEKEVELLIYYKEEFCKPVALVELGKPGNVPGSLMGDPVLLLSLYPRISTPKPGLNSTGEFLFLLDCSNDMSYSTETNPDSQSRIQSAKEMVIFLLKSLPLGSYFNIYAFGCNYYSFYPKSVKYTQWTMLGSLRRVMGLKANLGDAEILQPLKAIYSQPYIEGYARQLFLFTHRETSDMNEVIAEVETHSSSHRCFTFGIGEWPATHTLNSMAEAGHGCAEFIKDTEKMPSKALQSMKKALDPVMMDISLQWDLPPGLEAWLVQPIPQVIYTGECSLICAQICGQQQDVNLSEGSVVVQHSMQGWTFTERITFSLQVQDNERFPLHRLAARAFLQELKGTRSVEEMQLAVETSLSSGVACSQTAYIVVNTEPGKLSQIHIYFQNLFGFWGPYDLRAYDDIIELIEYKTKVESTGVIFSTNSCQWHHHRSLCRNTCIFKKIHEISEFLRKAYYSAVIVLASSDLSWKSYSSTEDFLHAYSVIFDQPDPPTKESLVLRLICLQNADGSWPLEACLLNILGLDEETFEKMPNQVAPMAWATVLVILWLHIHAAEESDTSQLLQAKALGWLHENAGLQLAVCVQAGNTFLGCDINLDVFGL